MPIRHDLQEGGAGPGRSGVSPSSPLTLRGSTAGIRPCPGPRRRGPPPGQSLLTAPHQLIYIAKQVVLATFRNMFAGSPPPPPTREEHTMCRPHTYHRGYRWSHVVGLRKFRMGLLPVWEACATPSSTPTRLDIRSKNHPARWDWERGFSPSSTLAPSFLLLVAAYPVGSSFFSGAWSPYPFSSQHSPSSPHSSSTGTNKGKKRPRKPLICFNKLIRYHHPS